jgi:hypothetical protein
VRYAARVETEKRAQRLTRKLGESEVRARQHFDESLSNRGLTAVAQGKYRTVTMVVEREVV